MTPTPTDFFTALLALPQAQPALEAFRQALARPLPPPPRLPLLLGCLLDEALPRLGAQLAGGSAHWEWRPVYGLARELDPAYFQPEQIERRLEECPPLPPEGRRQLQTLLERFFQLAAEDLLPSQPLAAPQQARHWAALLGPGQEWAALEALRRAGFHPGCHPAGQNAMGRYSQALFAPPMGAGPESWSQTLQAAASLAPPHELDFLAAALAGGYPFLDFPAPCGPLPHCSGCPLAQGCQWNQERLSAQGRPASQPPKGGGRPYGQAAEPPSGQSSYGVAAIPFSQTLQGVETAQLLQTLFDQPGKGAGTWSRNLAQQGLRRLAGQDPAQWRALAPGGPPPEKLAALMELSRRFNEERLEEGQTFNHAGEVFGHFRMRLRDARQESFLVAMLDVKRRFVGDFTVTQGTLEKSLVHPREVFSQPIRQAAASIILVHNHPSGDPQPSKEDINVTLRLVEAGKLMGIPVLDHIIIGEERYFSLREHNLLSPG